MSEFEARSSENQSQMNDSGSPPDSVQAKDSLTLDWCFGMNKSLIGAAHSLSDGKVRLLSLQPVAAFAFVIRMLYIFQRINSLKNEDFYTRL